MTDQTFREIQLSGKQIFFAFMASVVVLVAAFLLGVSVGRGVRPAVPPGTDVVTNDPPAPATLPPPTEAKPSDLTYHDKLAEQTPPKPGPQPAPPPGQTPPAAGTPANATGNGAAAAATPPPATTPAAQPPAQTAASTAKPPAPERPPAAAPPARGGYVLQMGSFRSRENAQTLAADLKKHGYPTTITTAPTGAFVVRVGPYADRAEAERMQARLQRERGSKPLIQSR